MLDCVKSICGLSDSVNVMYVDIALDSFNSLNSTISNVKDYAFRFCAAIDGILFTYSEELEGRYGYFSDYLSLRRSCDPNDQTTKIAFDALKLSYSLTVY